MKMYKKSELSMNHGLIVSKEGDIILPDVSVVDQANRLEDLAQKQMYLASQPEATPMPNLDGFERVSIKNSGVRFNAKTPHMDSKINEAMAIMSELDDMTMVAQANKMLKDFNALLEFVESDFVIDCGNELYCFDTPMLGSVLELTKEDVADIIADVCGMVPEGVTKREVMIYPFTGETKDVEDEPDSDEE